MLPLELMVVCSAAAGGDGAAGTGVPGVSGDSRLGAMNSSVLGEWGTAGAAGVSEHKRE